MRPAFTSRPRRHPVPTGCRSPGGSSAASDGLADTVEDDEPTGHPVVDRAGVRIRAWGRWSEHQLVGSAWFDNRPSGTRHAGSEDEVVGQGRAVPEGDCDRTGRPDRDLGRVKGQRLAGCRADRHADGRRGRGRRHRADSDAEDQKREEDAAQQLKTATDQRMSTHAVYVLRSSFDLWILTARLPANSSSIGTGTTVFEEPFLTFSSGNFGCGVRLSQVPGWM